MGYVGTRVDVQHKDNKKSRLFRTCSIGNDAEVCRLDIKASTAFIVRTIAC